MSDPADDDMAVAVLRPGQQRAGAAAIAAGHADYPAFRHVFPDPRCRARVLPVFFEATVRDAIPYGSVLAATNGDRVVATAVWLPPGRFPWTPWRKLRAAPALARVMVAAPRAFRTFMRYGANVEAAHRDEPHWYLVVTACPAGSRPPTPPTWRSTSGSASRSPTRRSQQSPAVLP